MTHLGNVLQTGDLVLGYDIAHSTTIMDELESLPHACPDVILVRKTYPMKFDATKQKTAHKERKSSPRQQDISPDDIDIDIDLNDKMMDTAVSLVEDEIIEDANANWLNIDTEDYQIYRQQLHDETELAAEMLIKSTRAKLEERENQP